MTDPMSNIEDEKTQVDLGIMLHRVYRGALEDNANWVSAYFIVAAFVHGMFKSSQDGGGE